MKQTHRLISFLLLLLLTACGTGAVIRLENLEIEFPARSSASNTPSATATALPTASPTATASPVPTQALGLLARTTANVNLRTAPNTSNIPIRVIPAGTEIRLIERLADNTWARTAEGWVYTQNLSITGNINTLPIYQTPTPEPTPTQEIRTNSRISYNINGEGVPDTAYLLQVMTSPCKTMALVMNNLSLAVRIKELCPDAVVVSRGYSSLEGSEWFYRSPQNWIEQWKREGHPEIVRHSTNEPSYGGMQSLSTFVAIEIELMRLARLNGFTVAMGNFSVGNFQLSDIERGAYDSYIRAINQYGHYLALHEYSVALLPFGVGLWPANFLLDRNLVQPASWPTVEQLPIAFVSGTCESQPVYPSYWYLRRGDWFLLRADCIGIVRPRILLTEFAWDNLSNIKPQIEPLRTRYGLPQYMFDMRGINTYPSLWAYYFPYWSFAQAACQQLLWAERIYPPEYIGMAMFTWSTSPDWRQTDFSGRENPAMYELHDCLEQAAA